MRGVKLQASYSKLALFDTEKTPIVSTLFTDRNSKWQDIPTSLPPTPLLIAGTHYLGKSVVLPGLSNTS